MSDAAQRIEALARFARLTGLPDIGRIVQRGRDHDTARYTVELVDGRQIRLGTIKAMWSQAEFSKVTFVALGIVPDRVKPAEWQAVLGGLAQSGGIDIEEVQGERFEDTVEEWLGRYLDTAALATDQDGAAAQGLPFREGDDIYVSAGHLARFVRREFAEQVKLPELRTALTDLGYSRQTVMYKRGRRRSSTSYYVRAVDAPGNEGNA